MGFSKFQFRSISLPSRLHPINPTKTTVELQNLQTREVFGTVSITSEFVQSGLVKLAQLYNFVEITHFSATQKSQLIIDQQHQHEKSMQESSILEGSIELLDICNTIRELVQMMKENVQALQSTLRRKGLDFSIQSDLIKYSCFRKKMNKIIAKIYKKIKSLKLSNPSINQSFIRVLREAIEYTIVIFKCVLGFLCSPKPNPSRWNLVSKLMMPKSVDFCADYSVVSEVGSVDFGIKTLQEIIRGNNCDKISDNQMLQKSLMNLDVCIEELEEGLGGLFRQLLRFRVKLLNILNDY